LQKTNLDLQQQFYGISCLKLLENCTYMENIQLKLWFSGTFVPLFGSKILKKCCCKWQVVFCNLSPLYEHLCGNRVGRVDLIFLWQFIVAQFWKLSNQCVMISKKSNAHFKEYRIIGRGHKLAYGRGKLKRWGTRKRAQFYATREVRPS
jgi:hypothetical protein